MPLATASQAVMPPKTLTKTHLTSGSDEDDLQAVGHHLGQAPPPMSRKLAGFDAAVLLTGVRDDVEGAT